MSNGLNKCEFIGNLGADAELQTTPSGAAVLKFRIGCSESWKGKDCQKQTRTEWIPCVMWGNGATAVAAYLTKGKQIFVAGRFQTNMVEKDGQKRYFTSINVKDLLLLGGHARGESPAPAQQKTNGAYSDEDYQAPGGDDGDFPF